MTNATDAFSNQTISSIIYKQVESLTDEMQLPCTHDTYDTALKNVDTNTLSQEIDTTIRTNVGKHLTDAILTANNIPRVTMHVSLENYNNDLDMTCTVDEFNFDCTAALEIFTNLTYLDSELENFLGYIPEDDTFEEDLSPEDLDAIFRTAEDIGLVNKWDNSFWCYISNGWDAWAKHRLMRRNAK